MISFKPFGRRIQVSPEQSKGIIKTAETNIVEKAKVIAIGGDVGRIQVGDTILFTSFGVDSIDIGQERYYFLLEDDDFILATYVEEV